MHSLKYIFSIFVALAGVALLGCTDDTDFYGDSGATEGEPVLVDLKLDVDDVTIASRSVLDDRTVRTLWVATFNATNGRLTGSRFYGEGYQYQVPTDDYHIVGFPSRTGMTYFVAVANFTDWTAVSAADGSSESLADALGKITTWGEYRSLAVSLELVNNGKNVSVAEPGDALLMAGAVTESANEEEPLAVEIDLPNKLSINNKYPIRLRRLMSQNTFNIKAAPLANGATIIEMEVVDVEVLNLPRYSWLQSRAESEAERANAGDAVNPEGGALNNPAYPGSLRFTPPANVTFDNGVYSFTYWQFENRRTGTSTEYADRERQYTAGDGLNTGVYTSLCPTADGSLNNNATMVRIRARIEYLDNDNLNNPPGVDLPKSVKRTAEVSYVVHLGYIKNDASDFTVNRNYQYTYNISARSVNEIILEAFREGNNQPGAEGEVTDTDLNFDLDAHYNAFNVYLTASQIQDFAFSLVTYDGGVAYKVDNLEGSTTNYADAQLEHYDWVELVPTGITANNGTYETRLAPYPGSRAKPPQRYLLSELAGSGLPGQWFTVYVKEYTYENSANETGTGWHRYVDQPSRSAWLCVTHRASADGASNYYRAGYSLTQRSIQTYYNVADPSCRSAIGLEHVNECLGFNMRWSIAEPDAPYTTNNGRYNSWLSLGGNYNWNDYVDFGNQQLTPAITNVDQIKSYEIDNTINKESHNWWVPLNKTYEGLMSYLNDPQASTKTNKTEGEIIPGHKFVEAAYACLNRNRDENGNGVIDHEEMRWYLPATDELLYSVYGRGALSSPLPDYQQSTLVNTQSNTFLLNTMHHFAASNGKALHVEAGLEGGDFNNAIYFPWQVRCARQLGMNRSSVPSPGDHVSDIFGMSDYDASTKGV